MKPEQCRAARALLGWSQGDAAQAAGVNKRTLMDFESGNRTPHPGTLALLMGAFETAGIQFIAENGGGEGVRFRQRRDERVPAAG